MLFLKADLGHSRSIEMPKLFLGYVIILEYVMKSWKLISDLQIYRSIITK